MPIHLRLRGKTFYARGIVRVGTQSIPVAEFSTGQTARAAAEAVAAAHEAEIRADILDGAAGRARRLTVADALASYIGRPGGISAADTTRIAELNDRIGAHPLTEASDAWQHWMATRGSGMAPGGAARWRSVFHAAIAHGCKARGLPVPSLPTIRQPPRAGVPYLTLPERDRLLAAYSKAAAPVAVVLAFQGLRTQEALRLDWRDVSWPRRTLFVGRGSGVQAKSKTGKSRTVPMHRQVRVRLYLIWRQRGRPIAGPVFLSSRGAPFQDTTGKGGNPLKKQHAHACATARIRDFRVHDWRHHWAAHMVMSGTDLYTLMRLGGWSTLRMVERYAAVSVEHMAAAVARMR